MAKIPNATAISGNDSGTAITPVAAKVATVPPASTVIGADADTPNSHRTWLPSDRLARPYGVIPPGPPHPMTTNEAGSPVGWGRGRSGPRAGHGPTDCGIDDRCSRSPCAPG